MEFSNGVTMRLKQVADKTGKRFGRLVVIGLVGRKGPRTMWRCRCDCGTVKDLSGLVLATGATKSCGCLKTDVLKSRAKPNRQTPEFRVWCGMIARCDYPNATGYQMYGGRGITVAEEWRDFDRFFADMGARPGPDYDIDRIDNNKGYAPGNCRWASRRENCRNTRRNHRVTFRGKTMSVVEWSEETGLDASAIRYRLKIGWAVEDALTIPSKRKR